jgi:hypothetical protein
MARFQTVIKHARFVYSPYSATEMQGFAQVLADSIRARIQSGRNIYDQAAAPLKPGLSGRRGYPEYKAARGLQSIRDWTWSGHTLRCLKVLTANENRAAIGFLDETLPGRRMTASQIAAFNNGAKRSGACGPATTMPCLRPWSPDPLSAWRQHDPRFSPCTLGPWTVSRVVDRCLGPVPGVLKDEQLPDGSPHGGRSILAFAPGHHLQPAAGHRRGHH